MGERAVDRELVSVVNRRLDLLSALNEPTAKRDLVADLDLSRSTVDRAVRQLESMGLVTRDPDYRLTVTGRLVRDLFNEFVDDLADVVETQELLSALPPDAPMSTDLLEGATVHWPGAATPTAPVSEAIETLEQATRCQFLIPRVTRPDVLDAIESTVVEDEVPASLVVSAAVFEYLRTDEQRWLDSVTAVDHCEVRVADRLPYTLGLIRLPDSLHVGVIVYGQEGNVTGFVRNETLRAYAWGWNVFQDYHGSADPVDEVR